MARYRSRGRIKRRSVRSFRSRVRRGRRRRSRRGRTMTISVPRGGFRM